MSLVYDRSRWLRLPKGVAKSESKGDVRASIASILSLAHLSKQNVRSVVKRHPLPSTCCNMI